MEALTIALLKAVATSCVKYYVSVLLAGTPIGYNKSDLGYKVPKWYMNPGIARSTLYAYGTSVKGDEFESISDAREQAIRQMVEFIRLSNQKMISEQIKFDESSLKQKRLIDLFTRGDELEGFIRVNLEVGKQDLVKVSNPETDIRAFLRIDIDAGDYNDFQTRTLTQLKTRLTRQKTEDIMAEMESEKKQGAEEAVTDTDAPAGAEKTVKMEDSKPMDRKPEEGRKSSSDDAFSELDNEMGK